MSTNTETPTSGTETEPTTDADATDAEVEAETSVETPDEAATDGPTEPAVEPSDESAVEESDDPAVEDADESEPTDTPGDHTTDDEADPDADATDSETDADDSTDTDGDDTDTDDEEESEADATDEPAQRFEACVEARALQDALDSVGVLVDECRLHLEPGGLEARAVDPANVGMVDMSLDAESFETWQAGGGVIGINLDRFDDILGMADKDDLVHLDLNAKTRKLDIEIDGLEYTMALIDPDTIRPEPDIPDMGLPAEIKLKGEDLDRAVTAADMVDDTLAFAVERREPQFVVEAEGDTDDVRLELTDGDGDLVDARWGEAHSIFSLDYLKDMNKAIPKDATVTMDLGEELPVTLAFDHDDADASVEYMLAPRIST